MHMTIMMTSSLLALALLAGAALGDHANTHEKECPADEPIPFTACDNNVFRNGLTADDPPCEYGSCPTGDTAVCGCVDLSAFGGSGVSWQCQKGSCECPEYEVADDQGCNVTGADFQDPSFVAPWRLDSGACGDSCQCHPVYGDGNLQDEWQWHCSAAAAAASPLSGAAVAGALAAAVLALAR